MKLFPAQRRTLKIKLEKCNIAKCMSPADIVLANSFASCLIVRRKPKKILFFKSYLMIFYKQIALFSEQIIQNIYNRTSRSSKSNQATSPILPFNINILDHIRDSKTCLANSPLLVQENWGNLTLKAWATLFSFHSRNIKLTI